jgi:hypothetical protein
LCEHDITPRNIRGEFRPKDLICEVRKVTPWGTARLGGYPPGRRACSMNLRPRRMS